MFEKMSAWKKIICEILWANWVLGDVEMVSKTEMARRRVIDDLCKPLRRRPAHTNEQVEATRQEGAWIIENKRRLQTLGFPRKAYRYNQSWWWQLVPSASALGTSFVWKNDFYLFKLSRISRSSLTSSDGSFGFSSGSSSFFFSSALIPLIIRKITNAMIKNSTTDCKKTP